jgi:predicted SnoaL-like aldol condensation-catalyzing enzyme
MDTVPASNCEIVMAFYQEGLVGKNPRSAFERHASPNFKEHKPDVEHGTREATIDYLEGLIKHLPLCKWELIRAISEGDFVVLHAKFIPSPDAAPYAVADIFRLECGQIVEHWDVIGQPAIGQVNPNPRF